MTIEKQLGQSKKIVSLGDRANRVITVDKERRDEFPIYKQIADELVRLVEEGDLPPGSRLPTVRRLAEQLEVTRVTIHSAYGELSKRGYAEAVVGRGTFIKKLPPAAPRIFGVSTVQLTPDQAMADLSEIKEQPDIISLAMAEPDPSLLPAKEFMRLFRSMEDRAAELLSYGPYQGALELRHVLVSLLREKGIRSFADDLIVTTGVTQGLSLSLGAICKPGDKVIVEQPTYLGFLSLLKSYSLEPVGVEINKDGPDLNQLEQLMQREQPKVYYTVPSFHNPSGICMSAVKRRSVLDLARRYNVTIIEDDVYGHLQYDNAELRPLKADDTEDLVIYVNSFSKVLLPGLRVGYMLPPSSLREPLMALVRCRELCGPPFLQHALAEFLRRGALHKHLKRVLPKYQARRDALLDALEIGMPDEAHWNRPTGGFCCWVTLPAQIDFEELYNQSLHRGVAYTPGSVFFMPPRADRHMRVCFGNQDTSSIQRATETLGKLTREMLHRPGAHPPRRFSSTPVV
ncbi:MAG: PLP-dependent aminotransferase family protein [Deltaproteobacteria bacterium]|nr:MAG: PLP-dependent aminotransferase family protein [Deltaproteobacteria bacterium]